MTEEQINEMKQIEEQLVDLAERIRALLFNIQATTYRPVMPPHPHRKDISPKLITYGLGWPNELINGD